MYSQLLMVRELATNDCKPLGTHRTLGLVPIIDELNSMEEDLMKRRVLRHISSFITRYKEGD
jgi:hypothetical protein